LTKSTEYTDMKTKLIHIYAAWRRAFALPFAFILATAGSSLHLKRKFLAVMSKNLCHILVVAIASLAGTNSTAQENKIKPGASEEKSIQDKPLGLVVSANKSTAVVYLGGGVKLELVRIKAGTFEMGNGESPFEGEKPVHTVQITKDFYMAKTETTQEQWEAVMGNNPSHFKQGHGVDEIRFKREAVAGNSPSEFKGTKRPVERISWDDTQEFFKKLKEKVNVAARLPTEAEWEYACRGGTSTKYHSGNDESDLADVGWYEVNSGGKHVKHYAPNPDAHPHEVGGKTPNAFGLYDMHGNVWELCSDWWDNDYYKNSPHSDPQGPATDPGNGRRVKRGGSWTHSAIRAHAYSRLDHRQNQPGIHVGFRLCVGIAP
jgi:formylglycine-generating enzyme required for sulfatase activity